MRARMYDLLLVYGTFQCERTKSGWSIAAGSTRLEISRTAVLYDVICL